MASPTIEIPALTDDTAQQNKLLNLQNQILENIVKGQAEFQQLLDILCHYAEVLVPDSVASVVLFQEGKQQLNVQSAPSASRQIIDDLSGLEPSLENGSCSHAVYSGQPVYVSNIEDDPSWSAVRDVARKVNIVSCWSYPVFLSNATAMGSFALSSFEERSPTDFQKNILKVCANLVSVILQQKAHDEELWRIAHHDALTGLPNRLLLDSQLKHAIRNADRNNKRLALMFIDLDNFKDINDSYGHDFGDRVLLKSMKLIKKCLREGDIVARHGGDEFLLILENFSDKMAVDNIAKKILLIFQSPLRIRNQAVLVHFSIGISLYPDDAETAQELLRNADIAMYQAKETGKNNIQYFEQKLADKIYAKVLIEQQLREALTQNELELYYQPTYIADTDEIESMEALIRWNHPEKGLLLPDDFLPIAEQSHLITEITLYVFHMACGQAVEWINQGYDLPRVSINFPTSQLTKDCAERMDELRDNIGLAASQIEIEITETMLMNRGKSGIDELLKMRSSGISLAMDDFGTGYSSLSQLKKLPLDKLKIDRSFIGNLATDRDDQSIVKTIIAMGKSLNMRIVAEGVETPEQQDFLLQNGCDSIQGFYRHHPVPAVEIEELLKKRKVNQEFSQ